MARPSAPPDRAEEGGPRVVIVGSGFGGLFAARALARRPVRATLVDRTNHHLFQPLLYQVATGILSSGEIAPPTRDVLRHAPNIEVLQGEVERVDAAARQLVVRRIGGGEARLPYDYLIVAAGVAQSYFGHDEFRHHTLAMKSLADALALREHIFGCLERAEWQPEGEERQRALTFAIVGAGPTGVELAGQLGELSRRSLHGNFHNFDPRQMRVFLLDAGERILPTYTKRQSRRAAAALERLGVEVHMSSRVTGVDATGITFTDSSGAQRRVQADTRLWAAGVQAAPVAAEVAGATSAAADRGGRIEVQDDCSLPGHPEIFVVGDMMALRDLPGLAEVAMQSGRHAAKMILADLEGRPRKPFRYLDLGSMAAVSRTSAVASFRGLHLSGRLGWVMWLGVHLFFLTGFKNRVTTVFHWGVTFLGRGRAERALTYAVAGPRAGPEAPPAATGAGAVADAPPAVAGAGPAAEAPPWVGSPPGESG